MTLWTRDAAAAATGGTARGGWAGFDDLQIDSRLVERGDLFVALTAARDGHDFAAAALGAGASSALVSRVPEGLDRAPLLVVDDVQAALEALGQAGRARTAARVIAVTGSVGKTSTKEMMRAALSPLAHTSAAVASFNNHWGVPLTLARCPAGAEALICEIGMNAPGEIAPLSRQARPDVALVTTVAAAHLAAFGSLDGIAAEKASIFEGLSPGAPAVWDADLPTAPILADAAARAGAAPVTFGDGDEADWRILAMEGDADGTRVRVRGPDSAHRVAIRAPGLHHARNAVAALAAMTAAGWTTEALIPGLESWRPFEGRGTRERLALPGGAIDLTDDAFNANPASLRAALAVHAAAPCDGRRIAILGDMLELGPTEAEMHADVAHWPETRAMDVVHTVGPLAAHLHAALPAPQRGARFDAAAEAAAAAADLARPGDTVLVKGSKGSQVSRVVTALRALGGPAR